MIDVISFHRSDREQVGDAQSNLQFGIAMGKAMRQIQQQ